MPKLMPAIEIGNAEVALHCALPQSYLRDLNQTATAIQTPRSELLRDFLAWGFDRFRREGLMRGMGFYSIFADRANSGAPVPETAPQWVRSLVESKRCGERAVMFIPYVTRDQWKALAQAVREVEREFLTASLSDVLALFIAWGFADYLAFARGFQREDTSDGTRGLL